MSRQDETIGALTGWAARLLEAAGIESARREARVLLAHGLGIDAASMRLRDRSTHVEADDIAAFRTHVARRAMREPLAHITGSQGFWTLDLAVSGATLIPRADSEALIESLLSLRPDRDAAMRLLDLGTGTGCLLLAALSEYPGGWGLGIDLSPQACDLAASNAAAAGLAARSAFLCGSWTDALSPQAPRFDLVLSNPPYIRSDEIAGLMPEVACFEPRSALDGGADGLDAYRIILSRLAGLLAPGGIAILELGAGQFAPVRAIAAHKGLEFVSVRADLEGVARAIALRLP
jgi:release factor glutamine methyltransferase